MKNRLALGLFAALLILLAACIPQTRAAAQTYCPKSLFGTDNAKPSAGQWWLCINYLQQAAQSGGPFASLPSGDIFVGNPSGQPAAVALSGDGTLSYTGALSVTKTGGVSFAASATTDTTNAANITTGTLLAARLPAPTSGALGGVKSLTGASHQFLTGISTAGAPVAAQPAAADVSGLAASATTDTTNAANISSGVVASARGGAGAVNGIVKANGSGVTSAAVAGTDYAPATTGSSVLKGNGSGGTAAATAGTDYETPANVASAIGTAIPTATTSQLYGGTGGAGAAADITLGTNLSITAGVLNATGGGGSGALTLISTQSGTGLSVIQWTGISSSVHDVQLRCHGLSGSTSGDPSIQVGIGATPTWILAGYYQQGGISRGGASGSVANDASNGGFGWNPMGSGGLSATSFGSMVLDISNLQLTYGSSVLYDSQTGTGVPASSSAIISAWYTGNVASGAAVTSIRISPSGFTISGSCSLYAYSGTS